MFGYFIIFKLAAQLIQTILTVVSTITPHALVYAPLPLIVPLVDAEDGVGQGVVAEKLSLLTHQPTQKA